MPGGAVATGSVGGPGGSGLSADRGAGSGTPPLAATYGDWDSYGVMLGFGLSIPVFFATSYAWVLWIVIPPLAGRLFWLRLRDRRRPEGRLATHARHG